MIGFFHGVIFFNIKEPELALMTRYGWSVCLWGRLVSKVISPASACVVLFSLHHGDKTESSLAVLLNGLDSHSVLSQLTAVSPRIGQTQPEWG